MPLISTVSGSFGFGRRKVPALLGPQLHFDPDNTSSYSGSGTTVTDLSTNAYDTGRLENGVGFSDGVFTLSDGVFTFDATDDYIDTNQNIAIAGSYTINVWAKNTSNTSNYRMLVGTETSDGSSWNYRLYYEVTTGKVIGDVKVAAGPVSDQIVSTAAYNDSEWHMLTFVRNTSTAKLYLYIDGVLDKEETDSTAALNASNAQEIWLGRSPYLGGSYPFGGSMGEVKIYNRALTASEISTKYTDSVNGYRGMQISLDGFQYSGSGTTWPDNTGYGNNGTLVNAPTYSTTNMGQFDFNGSTQYVNLGSTFQPTRSQGFSFNVWVNFDSTSGWQTFVGQDRSGDSVGRGAFYFQKATDGATGGDGTSNTVCIKIVDTLDNTIFAEDTTTVTTGVWYNFTATVSATELKLYKNGALVTTNSDSTAMAPATGDMIAGAGWYADALVDYVNGKMPIVQYFDRVLTADEVSNLYGQYSYRYTAETSGLYAQYLIEDHSGTTLTDSSGNSRDGDIVGATYNADGYFTLDGVNDYLVTDNMYGAISGGDTHTVEMWVYANASNDCLWSDLGSTNDPATSTYHFAGSQIIQVGPFHQIITGLWNGTAITRDVGTAGSLTGAWKHVVRTYNGTTLTSYVNATNTSGGVTMTFDSPVDDATNNWYIAAGAQDTTTYSGSTAGWLNGRIGIIRVYDRALSSAEVLSNYNGSKAKYGL